MFHEALPAVTTLILSLNDILLVFQKQGLSKKQQTILATFLTGIIMTGAMNMTKISFMCFGNVSLAVLSGLVHRMSIPWMKIQFTTFLYILKSFDIKKVHLQVDDTDLGKSKSVKFLYGVFRTLHKPTNGFQNAQNIVLVTMTAFSVTFPVAFAFYRPDPALTQWYKDKKASQKQKKKKGKATLIGSKPKRLTEYPTRNEIAAQLLKRVKRWLLIAEKIIGNPIKVISISADAAYLDPNLSRKVKKIFPGTQFISQIKSNQLVSSKNGKFMSAKSWFEKQGKPISYTGKLRNNEKYFEYHSARLHVKSHGRRLHIIALRYEGEEKYRFIAASDLSWRTLDIIRSYSLRWLIEVAIQDCKSYCGFGRRACLQGVKGAYVSVHLSLLVDCLLLTHSTQLDRFRSGQRLYTAGSIINLLRCESNLSVIKNILNSPNPLKRLNELTQVLSKQLEKSSRLSEKHIYDEDVFSIESNLQLKRKYEGI